MSRELKSRRIAALYNAKEYKAAAAFATDARRQHPEDARFPRLQGRALFDAGDRAGGVAVIEEAAKAFPKDTPTLYALADIYRDADRGTDAETALRQVLRARADQSQRAELSRLPAGDARRQAGRGHAAGAQGARGRARQRRVPGQPRLGALQARRSGRGGEVPRCGGRAHAAELRSAGSPRRRVRHAAAAWTRRLPPGTRRSSGDGEDVDLAAVRRKIEDARAKGRR